MDLAALESFIVVAKRETCVGNGARAASTRPGSHDIDWSGPHGAYQDRSSGDVARFNGRETITVAGVIAYTLEYFGGLVKA